MGLGKVGRLAIGLGGNVGQRASLARIGESFLMSLGFTANTSKDTIGIRAGIQPRFLPLARFGELGASGIPPPGSFGID